MNTADTKRSSALMKWDRGCRISLELKRYPNNEETTINVLPGERTMRCRLAEGPTESVPACTKLQALVYHILPPTTAITGHAICLNARTHAHARTHTDTRTHARTHAHTHTHSHSHTLTYTHTHTYTQPQNQTKRKEKNSQITDSFS